MHVGRCSFMVELLYILFGLYYSGLQVIFLFCDLFVSINFVFGICKKMWYSLGLICILVVIIILSKMKFLYR